jgi:hypothetical protein
MNQQLLADEIRLPKNEEPVAAVTILDGNGSVVRVVPATEFRRVPTIRTRPAVGRGTARSGAGGVGGDRRAGDAPTALPGPV